jgi:hypothetical protein
MGYQKNLSFHTDFKNVNLILLLVKSNPKKGLAETCFENPRKTGFWANLFLGALLNRS